MLSGVPHRSARVLTYTLPVASGRGKGGTDRHVLLSTHMTLHRPYIQAFHAEYIHGPSQGSLFCTLQYTNALE